MPYDESLAIRVRSVVAEHRGVKELRMFGGIAFKLRDHMFCGIVGEDLIVRLGAEAKVEEPHVRPMDFTGRPLKGIFFVAPDGLKTEDQLRRWIDRAIAFVRILPKKG